MKKHTMPLVLKKRHIEMKLIQIIYHKESYGILQNTNTKHKINNFAVITNKQFNYAT